MESNDDENTMAESVASWGQKIIGTLVVAAVVWVFGTGIYNRLNVSDLNSGFELLDDRSKETETKADANRAAVKEIKARLEVFEKWADKTEDNRYKSSDGVLERITRETADKAAQDELEELIEENIRIWTAIRLHIEKGEHQGAHYRLLSLEEYMRNDKKNNHKHQ